MKRMAANETNESLISIVDDQACIRESLSSNKLSGQQVFDLSLNQIRIGSISVPGIAIPYRFGGKQRAAALTGGPSWLPVSSGSCATSCPAI